MPCSLPGQLTAERSSNYFRTAGVPDNVKIMNNNIKLILIVCEPVRRMFSAFSMHLAHGNIANNMTFEEYLNLVTRKPVFGVFDQVRLKPACSASETS